MTIKELKKTGEKYFTLKPIPEPKESQVYCIDEYDRSEKAYWCYKFSNINSGRYFKGNKEVYTDFIF